MTGAPTVLITGAAGAIGTATARLLSSRGYLLVLAPSSTLGRGAGLLSL
jgi:NADP-dependent 3-hydroxy acid dehydrogenase YdfG